MTRSSTVRLSALALASAGVWVAYTQQNQAPAQLTVTRIADDLHVIVGSGGNVAVYTTDEGAILVDDKFERDVPQILEKVKSVTDKPVRYVLNTHLHGDHTGGNAKMLTAGYEVVAHENARTLMVEKKLPGLPRVTFSDRLAVHLGGKVVETRHYGYGHTKTDALLYFPARKVLHTGDMFVSGFPFMDYSSGGSGVAWPHTLAAALRDLDFDTVIPGHGPVMTREDLVKWKNSLDMLVERARFYKRKGQTREEAQPLMKLAEIGWTADPAGFFQRSFGGLWDELK